MDDQTETPPDSPAYQARRDRVASHRLPPGGESGDAAHHDPLPDEPAHDDDVASPGELPVLEAIPDGESTPHPAPAPAAPPPEPAAPAPAAIDPPATYVAPPPPQDALPGDAAPTPTYPLADDRPEGWRPKSVIINVEHPAQAAAQPARPRGFTVWLLIYLAAWTGAMSLTLHHRFDRTMDWNTSYFATAARNLVRDGFVPLRGGMYLTAGEGIDRNLREFYAGHPPMTAWLLAGWMKSFGQSDAAIRALPLTFTVLNLLLLYLLVRRIFGAPAALAATVVCSLMPMTAFYGQNVNMEPFVLTFMLGGALGYLGWSRSGSTFGFLFLCLCVILGCWTDWPMFVFTGFLAVAHLLKRRDLLTLSPSPGTPGEGRGEGSSETPNDIPPRPILASLTLVILAMAVFAAFLVYLKLNNSGFHDLKDRAAVRMGGGEGGHTRADAYHALISRISHPGELKDWFINLFTPPALLLAAISALFWVTWSRRLSIASGEAARRAAFRILLCLVLTQAVYTLAFPDGARVHEFWQYYLTVPVAILVAGLCTWLTVAGGNPRGFFYGLIDRAAWAFVAMIPIAAIGPFAYRMNMRLPGKPEIRAGEGLHIENAKPIRDLTGPRDVILTDLVEEERTVTEKDGSTRRLRDVKRTLPWYADRAILPHEGTDADARNTHTLEGIRAALEKYPNRKAWYLWNEQGPERLFEHLNKTCPKHDLPSGVLYDLTPLANSPATAPTTTPTTKPAP